MSIAHEVVHYAPTDDRDVYSLIAGGPRLCKANIRFSTMQFQDRLVYIDKRYDHLRKLTHSLRKKVNELEEIMRQDNDEENLEVIKTLLDDIKREKQVMRDEAHIIRGELSQAMYNEDLRSKILNFIEQFEDWWYDEPQRRLAGEWRRIEEERRADGSEDSSSTRCDDDSSSDAQTFRETSI